MMLPRISARSTGTHACLFATVLLGMLVWAAPALAHGSASNAYLSRVQHVVPAGLPITAKVMGRDDRIKITNSGDADLVVDGYGNDPYVRISHSGVFVNHNTSTYYTNQDRFGAVAIPKGIGKGAADWHRVSGGRSYEFHDHRIHWMQHKPPPGVDTSRPGRQKVFTWSIPIRYEARSGTIDGVLYYTGGHSFLQQWGIILLLFGLLGVMVVISVLSSIVRRKLGGNQESDTTTGPSAAH